MQKDHSHSTHGCCLYWLTGSLFPDILTCPHAQYLSGWSHGKEALRTGTYDTHKGSYYVNCAFYQGKDIGKDPPPLAAEFPQFTAPNVWPAVSSLPGFQESFEELCTLIIDTAVLVARQCDRYAVSHIEDYEPGYLERVVNTSLVTKARLLHYFPSSSFEKPHEDSRTTHGPLATEDALGDVHDDSWCATHVDHGCLTGLTSAIYIDEAAHSPVPPFHNNASNSPSVLAFLPGPPDPNAGLYIHARDSTVTKVSIPADCLGFQTGEALELITGGKFRAVPHFVRAGGTSKINASVARNTLAVFTQPNLEEIVDRAKGKNFGEFSKEVIGRFSKHS